METKNAWLKYTGEKKAEVFDFAEGYRKFISECKTERECANALYQDAKKTGFRDLDDLIASGETLKAGDRVIANNMGKGLAMCCSKPELPSSASAVWAAIRWKPWPAVVWDSWISLTVIL